MGCTPSKDADSSPRSRRRTWNALMSSGLSVRVAKHMKSTTDSDYMASIMSANYHGTIRDAFSSTKGIKGSLQHVKSNSMFADSKQTLDEEHNAMEDVNKATKNKVISTEEVEENNTQFETINTWELMEGLDEEEDEENISLDPRNVPLHKAFSFKYIFSRGNYEDSISLGLRSFTPPFSVPSSPEFSAAASLKDWLPSDNHSSKHVGELMGAIQSSIVENFQHIHVYPEHDQLKYVDNGPTQSAGNRDTQDDLCSNLAVMKDVSEIPMFDPELIESFEKAMLELSEEEWNAVRSTEESPHNFIGLVSSLKRSCSNSWLQLKMNNAVDLAIASVNANTINENHVDYVDIISKSSSHRSANQISSHDDRNQRKILWGKRLSFSGQNSWHLKRSNNVHAKRYDAKCLNVVLYSTTSQLDTKTLKDCNQVRGILISLIGVTFDEKSISNHRQHEEELMYALNISTAIVPTVYARGKYVVGIDSILQLYKKGLLGTMLQKAMHLES